MRCVSRGRGRHRDPMIDDQAWARVRTNTMRFPFIDLRHVLVCGLISIAAVAVGDTSAKANECQDQCDARYHHCNMGTAWAAELTCATQLRACQMTCSAKGFGSIAYSKKTRNLGFTLGHPSRDAAEKAAAQDCEVRSNGSSDCQPLIWFRGRCGALALGDGGAYGAAQHPSQVTASKEAITLCTKHGETCRVVLELCARAE